MQRRGSVLLILLLHIFSICSYAQIGDCIAGKVIRADGQGVSNVYIEVFVENKNSPATATVSDDHGFFVVKKINNVSSLKLQHVGYDPLIVKAPIDSSFLTLQLRERADSLGEVIILGHSSSAKIVANGIVFTPTETQRKMLDLEHYLSQIPFIAKDNGQYSVMGKSGAVIYIDNRQVYDLSELKRMNLDDVQSVDVIVNPDVAYAADIRSIIKIRTCRKKIGIDIELKSEINHDSKTEYWAGIRAAINKSTFSFQSSFNYNYDPSCATLLVDQLMGTDRSIFIGYNSNEYQRYNHIVLRNSFIYTPNLHHSLGAQIYYTDLHWKTDIINRLNYKDGLNHMQYEQSSISKSPKVKALTNVFYNYSDSLFRLSLNMDFYKSNRSDNLSSVSNSPPQEDNVRTFSNSKDVLSYIQLHGSYRFNSMISIDLGADFSNTSVAQSYKIASNNNSLGLSPVNIQTKQCRYAVYTSIGYQVDYCKIKIGLRYENIYLKRDDRLAKASNVLLSRFHIYPTISAQYNYKLFQWLLSYGMKTGYPTYSQLRAGMSYSSPYLYEGGNPDLIPEIKHEFSLIGRYDKTSMVISYSSIKDEIIQIPTLYTKNILLYRPENTGGNRYFSLAIGRKLNYKILESNNQVKYSYQWMHLSDYPLINGGGFTASSNNVFTINERLRAFVNVACQTKRRDNLYIIPFIWNVDIGLNLSMLSDNLRLYIECADIFSSKHSTRWFSGRFAQMDYNRIFETRVFTIGLFYNLRKNNTLNGKKKHREYLNNSEIQRL